MIMVGKCSLAREVFIVTSYRTNRHFWDKFNKGTPKTKYFGRREILDLGTSHCLLERNTNYIVRCQKFTVTWSITFHFFQILIKKKRTKYMYSLTYLKQMKRGAVNNGRFKSINKLIRKCVYVYGIDHFLIPRSNRNLISITVIYLF